MFTGIIQEIGTVASAQSRRGVIELAIEAPHLAGRVGPMESVAVNGACLSVVAVRRHLLVFEMISETRALTTLGELRRGDQVNLEPALTLADRLNGHVVLGHVDGLGRVVERRAKPGEVTLVVRIDKALRPYAVPKGSIAVDGVSLTIGQRLQGERLPVHLIPETLRRTTLGSRRVGERVNIEMDYLAKLVRRLVK